MNDYTPNTEDVREWYARKGGTGELYRTRLTSRLKEFDRWLEQVKAEAWEEGFDAGERDAFDLHEHPNHECIPNPYRKETNT